MVARPSSPPEFSPVLDDIDGARAALAEYESGEALSPADSDAFMRWLETGDERVLDGAKDPRVREWADRWPDLSV
ncbi:MAG: hypothetical protein ABTD50_05455 [Polyangiaceae bacterium]|jgi:hypothetical protein